MNFGTLQNTEDSPRPGTRNVELEFSYAGGAPGLKGLVSYSPIRVDFGEGIRDGSLGNAQDWVDERPLDTEMISISINSNVY